MRLNLSTVIVLVVSITLIAVAVILTIGGEEQGDVLPGRIATPETPNPLTGSLFATLNQTAIIHLEFRDHRTETALVMRREDGTWRIIEAVDSIRIEPDPLLIANAVGDMVGLIAVDGFTTDDLTQFGLDDPDFTLSMMTMTKDSFTLRVGDLNPSGNRYYVLRDDDDSTIYMISRNDITTLTALIDNPPYLPPPPNST